MIRSIRFPAAAPVALLLLLPAFLACSGPTHHDPPLIMSFSVAPYATHPGQNATLSWTATNADNLSISPDVGLVTGTHTTVSPALTTTYTLTAQGPGGKVTATTTLNVTTGPIAAWTWVLGNSKPNDPGTPGTLGTGSTANAPSARYGPTAWVDGVGSLWLLGGMSSAPYWDGKFYNDLWNFRGGQWTWVSGSQGTNPVGVYGTLGTADAANTPGGREGGTPWNGPGGTFLLYGGLGVTTQASSLSQGYLDDLWVFDGTAWTWTAGTELVTQFGTYGALDTPDPTNIPGGRVGGMSWTDHFNNHWLFGGFSSGSGQPGQTGQGFVNDLWVHASTGWTWVGGQATLDPKGTYVAPGSAGFPSARSEGAIWLDSKNNVWLLGGFGDDSAGTPGELSDLWKFDGTTWTWISGSALAVAPGHYGALGQAGAANAPGARVAAYALGIDGSDNLFLFGGQGYDSAGNLGYLDDLWMFDTNALAWTWVGGSNVINVPGVYGTQGTATAATDPGGRMNGAAWMDGFGGFWVFGGVMQVSAGDPSTHSGALNDLWELTIQ